MINFLSFLSNYIIAIILLFYYVTQANAIDIYAERNSVTTGDNSIVAVASGRSNVLIVYNESGSKESYTINQYNSYIYASRIDLIKKLKREFPDANKEIISSIAIAEYLFEQKNYSASAAMYSRAFNLTGKDVRRYQRIVNMATASYYGSSRHVLGLQYICSLYEIRPSWDYRYRHAIHAHLRSLAENLGHNEARKRLDHVRRNPKCQRDDFSPVWIPISLLDMEWLESSRFTENNIFGFSKKKDDNYAKTLLEEGGHGFIDYLLFINGDYERIISDFPNSYIYDMALLMNGNNKDYLRAKLSLIQYVEKYKKHSIKAMAKLYKRAIDEGDYKSIIEYKKRFGTNSLEEKQHDGKIAIQINDHTRVWYRGKQLALSGVQFDILSSYYNECPELGRKLNSGKLVYVYERVSYYLDQHINNFSNDANFVGWIGKTDDVEWDYRFRCIVEFSSKHLSFFTSVFKSIYDAFLKRDQVSISYHATNLKICGDLREREISGLHKFEISSDTKRYCSGIFERAKGVDLRGISFHNISAAALLELYEMDQFNNSSKLFLAGSALRNNGQYKEAEEVFKRYVQYHPTENYADDALAELGWIYLAVYNDTSGAESYFLRVVENYPSENAYDNALNWLVINYRMTGQLFKATHYALKLGEEILSSRLKRIIGNRDSGLSTRRGNKTKKENVYTLREEVSGESFFGETRKIVIVKTPKGNNGLEVGVTLNSIDGETVTSIDQVLRLIIHKRNSGTKSVTVNGDTNVPIDAF